MKQAKVLSKSEIARVVAVIDAGHHSERNKIAFYLTYLAGMRVKEVSAITVGDIYNENGAVRDQVVLSSSQTKGSTSRTVVFSKKLRKLLASYLSTLPSQDRDFPVIYSQKSNRRFSANSLCQVFARLYRSAGISGASSHSGRRTFITNLASKGVGAKVLMHLAGHRHLSTTQRYIDVNDRMLREAVELI